MATASEMVALLERLVELLAKLFSERITLARAELQESARQAGRRAGLVLAGGLIGAVGVAFVAAALTESLRPLLASLSLRLFAVSLLLLGAGALVVRRALRPAHILPRALPDYRDHDGEERQHQDQVGPRTEGTAGHQPHDQQ
jgi:hypothetical protein